MKVLQQFLKTAFIFTIILALLHYALFAFIFKMPYLIVYPFVLLYFLVFSVVSVYFIIKSTQKKPAAFVNTFLVSITIKMLLSLSLMALYIYFDRKNLIPFAMSFLIIYLMYLGLEVIFLVRTIKKIS